MAQYHGVKACLPGLRARASFCRPPDFCMLILREGPCFCMMIFRGLLFSTPLGDLRGDCTLLEFPAGRFGISSCRFQLCKQIATCTSRKPMLECNLALNTLPSCCVGCWIQRAFASRKNLIPDRSCAHSDQPLYLIGNDCSLCCCLALCQCPSLVLMGAFWLEPQYVFHAQLAC